MTRKLFFAAAMIGMGTLAGCSTTGNPLAPAADARIHAQAGGTKGTTTTTTTTSSATTGDEAPSDSLPGNSGEVIFTQGGN